jgi:hypothetical protein
VDKQANVELESWSKFDTPNLEIPPGLLGQSHVFTFEDSEIVIMLPTAESLPKYDRPGGWVAGKRLSLNTWNLKAGTFLWVIVHDANVVVSIPNRPSIPEAARTTPITHEFFSEEQAKHLDSLATQYSDLAYRAFDLWIRTLRWKADDYLIGTPDLSGLRATGARTEIREKDTLNRFWASGLHITVFAGKPVTVEVWNKVSEVLNAGESPPIFYDLLYSAMARLERGDLRRTIIDAAAAAETFMREAVQAGLSAGLDASLEEYSEDTTIRPVINKFFQKCLDAEQEDTYKKTIKKSNLHKLFDDRNDIMHKGQWERLTESRCQKLIKSVRELVSLEPIKAS